MHSRIRYGLLASTAAAVTFTVAACGGGTTGGGATTSPGTSGAAAAASSAQTPASASSGSSMPVTSSTAAGSTSGSAVSTEHSDADVTFSLMMIVHHQGAIEMAALAPDRAQSEQVKDLAARIEAAQAPEIDQMTSWLTAWGAAPMSSGMMMPSDPTSTTQADDMGGMDHGGMDHGDTDHGDTDSSSEQTSEATSSAMPGSMSSMPGMMSTGQMQQLQAASGAAFDKMFLELMIAHHQGAIDMADTELADGSNSEALALAGKIKTDQTAEITEMQTLLQNL